MNPLDNAFALPSELTLRQASGVLARLLSAIAALAAETPVCIQAQGMQVFDSSALAVLLECRRAALASGRAFAVDGLPSALAGLAALYGVGGLLIGADGDAALAG